jgi:hypothetical protein
MRALADLHRGLDGVLSVALAPPAGWAARGFIVELLARASWLEQQWAALEQRAAVMECHGASQLTRWLKVAGEHATILVVRGGDG